MRGLLCRSVLCVAKMNKREQQRFTEKVLSERAQSLPRGREKTNENSNGLLREFYPKGRNLSHVGEKTLKKNLALINARPKKVLGYKAPADLFEQELQKVLHLV